MSSQDFEDSSGALRVQIVFCSHIWGFRYPLKGVYGCYIGIMEKEMETTI